MSTAKEGSDVVIFEEDGGRSLGGGLNERKRKGELLDVLQLKWCVNTPSLRFQVHPIINAVLHRLRHELLCTISHNKV